jgi:hypothetical protein
MIKFLALITIITLCNAEDYYQLSIDHDLEKVYKQRTSDLKSDSSGYDKQYNKEEVDRKGYSMPSSYGYSKDDSSGYDSGSSYSAPYGYEKPLYKSQSYGSDSYGKSPSHMRYDDHKSYDDQKGYEQKTYVEKSYSSPISALRHIEIKPIQSSGDYGHKDHTIDVKDDTPIVIHFRTHANNIRVEQTRVPDKKKEVEHTRSEDEPHRVVHEVYKPVIQEIREIIQPFRKVVQQVQPVVEEVQTVVHKSDGRRGSGRNGDDDGDDYSGHRQEYGRDRDGYGKRSSGGQGKKYSTIKDYLPQGSVLSAKGIPVYRSHYKGPAVPTKKH